MKIYRFLWLLLLAVSSFAQTHTEVTIEDAQSLTGAKSFKTIDACQVVDGTMYTTIQAAITAAGTTGCVKIRPDYAGTDGFTNPNKILIQDQRFGAGGNRDIFNVEDFGAKGNHRGVSDASIGQINLSTVTSPTIAFTSADVGKVATIFNAGSGGNTVCVTAISAVTNSTTATVSPACITLQASVYLNIGTDDTAAINSTITAACAITGSLGNKGIVYFPSGDYFTTGGFSVSNSCSGVWFIGNGMFTSRVVLRQDATSDLLKFNGVSGPPSGIMNLGVDAAVGGNANQICVNLTNANGVFLDNVWITSCKYGLYMTGSSDVSVSNTISELNTENYYVTLSDPVKFQNCISYQATDSGFLIITGRSLAANNHTNAVQIDNSYDTESLNQGLYILSYNDVQVTNFSVQSQNNQRPVTGIRIGNAKRITLNGPKVTHTKQEGIRVESGSQTVNIHAPMIDDIGDYASVPATSLWGTIVTQGNLDVNIIGGTYQNNYGDGISHQGSGKVVGVSFIDNALNASSTQGLLDLELAVATANATDSVIVADNYFLHTGSTRGTAINVTSGNNYQITNNRVVAGSYTTAYNNASAGTGISTCLNIGFTNSCTQTGTLSTSTYQVSGVPQIYTVAADFTLAANTNLQTITGLTWTLPANTALNVPFSCHLMYSQATAAVADQFGIQSATIAPTNIAASGKAFTSASVVAVGTLATLASTTATAIVTFTPSATATVFAADLSGVIENPSNASTNVINIMAQTSNSADLVTVKRGSFCKVF